MPRGKKKKFIDKAVDNVVTFSLVHRSQKDPLVADENAPQKVLVPTASTQRNASAKVVIMSFPYLILSYLQHALSMQF